MLLKDYSTFRPKAKSQTDVTQIPSTSQDQIPSTSQEIFNDPLRNQNLPTIQESSGTEDLHTASSATNLIEDERETQF